MNVAMNKQGYESFETVLNNGMRAADVKDFEAVVEEGASRHPQNGEFAEGFIPQSINIGINGDFPWVGALIGDVKQPIVPHYRNWSRRRVGNTFKSCRI
jgi:hypothetical protein